MRRFALTCRNIVLDRLDEPDRTEAAEKGALPDRAVQWEYHGELMQSCGKVACRNN